MGLFKDPRMDSAFVRTWKSKEDYCAEEAIHRQDKIEALQKELAEYRKLGTVDYFRELVQNNKQGKWVLIRYMADGAEMKCSVCGRKYIFNSYFRMENCPYCHCGAKMDGVKDKK